MRPSLLTLIFSFLLIGSAFAPAVMAQDKEAAAPDFSAEKDAADTALGTYTDAKAALATAKEGAKDKSDEASKDAVASAEEAVKNARDNLRTKRDALAKADAPAEVLDVYSAAIDEGGVASVGDALGLIDRWGRKAKDWVINDGPGILIKIIVFLVILLVFKILAKIAGRIMRKALSTPKLKASELLKDFFVTVVSKVVFLIGVLIAISNFGVDIGPLLAGVGVIGFVVGFALQETLGNFASGIMILLYRPYDVGDVISAAGVTGGVQSMSLVSTQIKTPDNQLLVVPNSKIWGDVITNVTANDTRRVDLTIGIAYSDDIDKAEQVLEQIVTSHPKVLKDPAPVIKVGELGASSVDMLCRPWCATSDYWAVYWDLTKTIKQTFDKEGLNFPFPQQDVHLYRNEE